MIQCKCGKSFFIKGVCLVLASLPVAASYAPVSAHSVSSTTYAIVAHSTRGSAGKFSRRGRSGMVSQQESDRDTASLDQEVRSLLADTTQTGMAWKNLNKDGGTGAGIPGGFDNLTANNGDGLFQLSPTFSEGAYSARVPIKKGNRENKHPSITTHSSNNSLSAPTVQNATLPWPPQPHLPRNSALQLQPHLPRRGARP